MNEAIEKIEPLLRELATQLNTTVDYLWVVLVKQAYVEATISMIALIIAGLILYALFRYGVFLWNFPEDKKDRTGDVPPEYIIPGIIFSLVGGVAVIFILIIHIPTAVTGYINPEYWALNEILDKLP